MDLMLLLVFQLNFSFSVVADKFYFASINAETNLAGQFFNEMEKFGSFISHVWQQGKVICVIYVIVFAGWHELIFLI